MCGIAGVQLHNGSDSGSLRKIVAHQLRLIEHRGRDEEGTYADKGMALGMTRLSILDPEHGQQPMTSACGRYVIVHNGEVYNFPKLKKDLTERGYDFTTNTDTEVILHSFVEYGPECVENFNGMFAFAVWDKKERALFIARDRFGIKPLYYHAAEPFCFASEVKGILAVPGVERSLDRQGLMVYLSHNYLPPPHTLFRNIRQLEPGCSLTLRPGGKRHVERWHRLKLKEPLRLSEPDLDERFASLFEQAVERQLISDVPLGAFLSGGLDSTAIVSVLVEKKGTGVNTYSVGFDEPGYDESPYALEVASLLGTEHHPIRVDCGLFERIFDEYHTYQDNPVADQATVPILALSRLARQNVKVCLSGDGGDELLAGYVTIHADKYQPWMQHIPSGVFRIAGKILGCIPASTGKVSFDYKLRSFICGAGLSREDAHATWRMIQSTGELRRLLGDGMDFDESWLYQPYREAFAVNPDNEFFRRAETADIAVWLAGNNLPKMDSMSMGANLEARVPFLDNDLAEFMLRIPKQLKVPGGRLKAILKRYLIRKGFSRSLVYRKKAGFHSPIAMWFKGPMRRKLETIFGDHSLPYKDGVIRPGEPLRLLNEHFHGRANHAFRLFGLALFFTWYQNVYNARWTAENCTREKD